MKINQKILFVIGGIIFIIALVLFVGPYANKTSYSSLKTEKIIDKIKDLEKPEPIKTKHIETPASVRGIYMTACVASTQTWRESLKDLIKTTELNSIVIDIKDSTGSISFVDNSLQTDHGSGCLVKNMREIIEDLHKENIYVIGRISVFQDPLYTKLHPELAVKSKTTGGIWKDRKGLSFVDVNAKPYWDHIIKIAESSYELGFDEINFDYIRYPTDGNIKDTNYTWSNASSTKSESLESFFSYLHKNLKDTGMKTSADLFGLVTIANDDLGIGQVLEKALPYFDYIYPMVYPSHFGPGSGGYAKPAEHPYEIIKYSMGEAVKKEVNYRIKNGIATSAPSQLKPWLQDFDLGATYGEKSVRGQIQATYDVGLTGWLMWDAGNKYTPSAYLLNQ